MRISNLVISGFLTVSCLAWGQTNIYRCAGPEGVVYGDFPCAARDVQKIVGDVQKVNWQIGNEKRSDPAAKSEPATRSEPATSRIVEAPLHVSRLFIGMTDTQALNLAAWGRPSQIIRSKSGRVWRERWIYKDKNSGGDRGSLLFENSRLVDQEEALAGSSEPLEPAMESRAAVE